MAQLVSLPPPSGPAQDSSFVPFCSKIKPPAWVVIFILLYFIFCNWPFPLIFLLTWRWIENVTDSWDLIANECAVQTPLLDHVTSSGWGPGCCCLFVFWLCSLCSGRSEWSCDHNITRTDEFLCPNANQLHTWAEVKKKKKRKRIVVFKHYWSHDAERSPSNQLATLRFTATDD